MKIKKEQYDFIKVNFEHVINKAGYEKVKEYHANILKGEIGKDKEKLFRWNMLHYCKIDTFICDTLYRTFGINDNHIDTALKAIVKELNI